MDMRFFRAHQPYLSPRAFKVAALATLLFALGSMSAALANAAFSYEVRLERDAYEIGQRCGQKATIAYEMFGTCLGEELLALSEKHSLARVSDTLAILQRVDDRARDCHLAGHLVAEARTRDNPSDWERILSQVDHSACLGGFFHGVLEGYLTATQHSIDGPFITTLCAALDTTAYGEGSCGHILGHAVLVQAQGDIPASVAVCDRVPEYLQPLNCYIGVFMEYTTKTGLIDHGLAEGPYPATRASLDEFQQLCESLKGEYSTRACWGEVARIAMEYTNRDLAASARECQKALRASARSDCMFFSAFGKVLWEHPSVASVHGACTILAPYGVGDRCISGIAQSLLYASSENAPISISVCAAQASDRQEACFAQVGAALVTMKSAAERELLCRANVVGEGYAVCANRLFVNG